MSNYSNFDLRKFLAEGKKAKDKSMEEQEEVALSENEEVAEDFDLNEGTDILQMVLNDPSLLGYLATYGASLFAAVKGGMSAMDYCDANPDNKLCQKWKSFQSDFSSAKKTAREKGRGYEEGVEEITVNEEPVSIAAVAAGVASIFGGSALLAKLMDKAQAGDFGPKGKAIAKHLGDMGDAAARVKRMEETEEEVYEANHDDDDKKMEEAKFKAEIKTILES